MNKQKMKLFCNFQAMATPTTRITDTQIKTLEKVFIEHQVLKIRSLNNYKAR